MIRIVDYELKPVQYRLAKLFQSGSIIPFVGAGLSAGCGLPTWGQLLEYLVEQFGCERNLIRNQDYLRVAEYLAHIAPGGHAQLVALIEEAFKQRGVGAERSDAHLLLAALNAPVVYTTNYDNLIESAYRCVGRGYHVITTLDDLVVAGQNNRSQIVKFHGSFEKPETIVLREETYFKRLDFETPLDIKLRADILGKSVIFLGYSFSDVNIRYMFYKLKRLAVSNEGEDRRLRSYIVLREYDEVEDVLLQKAGMVPIYLSEYPGGTLTDKMTAFLQGVVHIASREGTLVQPVATSTVISELDLALKDQRAERIDNLAQFLARCHFPRVQLELLLKGVEVEDIGTRWERVYSSLSEESHRVVFELLVYLFRKYRIADVHELLLILFLRYPKVRRRFQDCEDTDGSLDWDVVNELYVFEGLSEFTKRKILRDAKFWLSTAILRQDTTFWFMRFLIDFMEGPEAEAVLKDYYERLGDVPTDPVYIQSRDVEILCKEHRYSFDAGGTNWPS